MSTLKEKSESILAEKESKIIPENIKSGVQIFGVNGTYAGDVPIYRETEDKHISNLACIGKQYFGTGELEGFTFTMHEMYTRINYAQPSFTMWIDNISNTTKDTTVSTNLSVIFYNSNGEQIQSLGCLVKMPSVGNYNYTSGSGQIYEYLREATSFSVNIKTS